MLTSLSAGIDAALLRSAGQAAPTARVLRNDAERFNIGGSMRVLAVLVLAPAFALGAAAGAVGLVGGDNGPTQKADSLVWADRVFVTRHELAKWLEARGVDYVAWAQLHPAAASVFDNHGSRRMAASSSSRLEDESRRRARKDHALLAALLAGLALAALLAVNALRARIARYSRSHAFRRPAWTAGRRRASARTHPRHPLVWIRIRQVWPRIASRVMSLLPERRAPGQRRPPTVALAAGIHHPIVRLPTTALTAARRHAPALNDPRDTLVWRRIRHVWPRIAFYVLSALLSVALGASVAIYLR